MDDQQPMPWYVAGVWVLDGNFRASKLHREEKLVLADEGRAECVNLQAIGSCLQVVHGSGFHMKRLHTGRLSNTAQGYKVTERPWA